MTAIIGAIVLGTGAFLYRGASRFQKQISAGVDPMDMCWPESFLIGCSGIARFAGIGIVGIGGVTMLF